MKDFVCMVLSLSTKSETVQLGNSAKLVTNRNSSSQARTFKELISSLAKEFFAFEMAILAPKACLFISTSLLVASLSALNGLAIERTLNLTCLPRFRSDPNHFQQCKKNICFLLRSEVPFIHLDPRMEAENNQTLFQCKDRGIYFPDLRGFIFDIKDAIPDLDNALCVYSGNNCSPGAALRFVERQSAAKEKYWFATSAIMFLVPERITPFTIPTVPILGGDMVIVGPQSELPRTKNIFKTVFLPFDSNASLFVAAVLLGFLLLWITGICVSIHPLNWSSFWRHFVGDYEIECSSAANHLEDRDELHHRDQIKLWTKVWTKILSTAFIVLLTMFIIFFELVAFDWIFANRSRTVTIDLQSLTKSELSEYIVPGGTALEFEFRRNFDPKGKFGNDSIPYNRCLDFSDCYRKTQDKTHPAKFQATFDLRVRYDLQKNGACDRLVIYKTKKPVFSYFAVWYLSSNVPEALRRSIDKSILTLRSTGRIWTIMSNTVDDSVPLHCGKPNQKIDAQLLGPLIAVVIGPVLIFVILSYAKVCVHRARLRKGRVKLGDDICKEA